MIHVRCPITGKVFSYAEETEIPDGQVFERVTKYRVTVGKQNPVAVFGSSLREGLTTAVQMAQRNPMTITSS